ncbi:MAG: SWIM zinc finger family protein, partial [Thermoproteota archaeon]|nr:SWIM zinc finger family protein [Thermoproteota archaeon]
MTLPAISYLKFPFCLKKDQIDAAHVWVTNGFRGTILYSSGTGKTEIAFECARRAASSSTLITIDKECSSFSNDSCYSSFNILYLVPRIVLIEQNYRRLLAYGIPSERIGVYFGERKQIREITISTYNSIINNLDLVRKSNMVIFDVIVEDHNKAILGLTATIDETDHRYNTIMTLLPPIKKYPIKDAVKDRRLARPIIIPLKVDLTDEEQKIYDTCSAKIKNISNRFKKYDAKSMSLLLSKGGFVSGLAKAWFLNVRKRKLLLSCAENKLSTSINTIIKKHPHERIMIFSESLDSINKLRDRLESEGIKAMAIDSKMNSTERQVILSKWGRDFYPLLSVHTLEIGYDVPQVRIEIILASTSNMNQVIQRIGRVIRKYEGKELALIYVVYVSDTKDDNILNVVKKAIDTKQEERGEGKEKEGKSSMKKRLRGAYNLIESSLYEPVIVEEIHNQKKLFRVRSSKEKSKFYDVDVENKTCSCPDFKFRLTKCKHI